jgi:hypothetical protein
LRARFLLQVLQNQPRRFTCSIRDTILATPKELANRRNPQIQRHLRDQNPRASRDHTRAYMKQIKDRLPAPLRRAEAQTKVIG